MPILLFVQVNIMCKNTLYIDPLILQCLFFITGCYMDKSREYYYFHNTYIPIRIPRTFLITIYLATDSKDG
jgi:hypothetical protein